MVFIRNLWVFLFLLGCSPSSSEDFQKEGNALHRRLIDTLKKIESREDLVREEKNLKKQFDSYADLMIQAREYQLKHLDEGSWDGKMDPFLSDQLKNQLKRVYSMEGGREIVEKAQQEALVRLYSVHLNGTQKG